MNLFDTLILVVAFGLIALVYYFIKRDRSGDSEKSGNLKADAAYAKPLSATKRFAAMQQYKVLSPVHLAKNGKFADFDFVLVGTFGLLCVKCIGLGGEIYGNVSDDEWLQIQKGNRTNFENPMKKASNDLRVVRDTLFEAKLKNIPVESVVVFTNKKATLALPRSTGHYTVKEFRSLISKSAYLADKKVDIEKAVAAVSAYTTNE